MSLMQAVKFRHLIAQLDKQELQTFLERLAKQSPDLIITALSDHFTKSAASKQTTTDAQNTNTLISKVLLNRKEKQKVKNHKQTESMQPISLQRMPKVLMGEISSFLPQYAYYRFMRVCRACYLACYQPNKLSALCLPSDSASIDLDSFPFAKRLRLDDEASLSMLSSWQSSGTVLPALEALSIDIDASSSVSPIVAKFITSNVIDFKAIKRLYLGYFHEDHILELLPKLTNLVSFEFMADSSGNMIDVPNLPQLKALSIDAVDDFEVAMLNAQLQHLESVYIRNCIEAASFGNLASFDFSRLLELRLEYIDVQLINDIFHCDMNLQKVALDAQFDPFTIDEAQNSISSVISKVITSCKSLQYFSVYHCPSRRTQDDAPNTVMENTLSGIEAGLIETTDINRKRLKINIQAPRDFTFAKDCREFVLRIVRIINCLQMGNVEDFMLIWSAHFLSTEGKQNSKKAVSTLTRMLKNAVVRRQDTAPSHVRFVITNKDCAICGYKEPFQTDFDCSH